MNTQMDKLIIKFLRDLASRMGYDGCNDYEWPTWFPKHLRRTLVDLHAEDDPEAYQGEDEKMVAVLHAPVDFIVVYALADYLESKQ